MKAAIVDGRAVYVSDTNFSADGVYLRLPEATRLTVERAILGTGRTWNGVFATTKRPSLQLEAALLNRAVREPVRSIDVESESFGSSPVSDAPANALVSHVSVDVTVKPQDVVGSSNATRTLAQLRDAGARIHLVTAAEKIAIAGQRLFRRERQRTRRHRLSNRLGNRHY
jgi:hypothetical protein